MDRFCPYCGAKLLEHSVPSESWVKCYSCTSGCDKTYIEAIDIRNTYPLIETFPKIPELLKNSEPVKLREAAESIKFIDCKTVSIVEFEKCLLNT